MEVRYIVFSPDEARAALISFLQKQGTVATPNDILALDFVGPNDAPSSLMQLRGRSATELTALGPPYLIAALLLYCGDQGIPIRRRAEKRVELSINGLTLVLTSDKPNGSPLAAITQISYGETAARATNELATARAELSRAEARANYAEGRMADAEERERRTEAARSRVASVLVSIHNVPGLRGRLGRWLVRYKPPTDGRLLEHCNEGEGR
jgi:hypothetical protein